MAHPVANKNTGRGIGRWTRKPSLLLPLTFLVAPLFATTPSVSQEAAWLNNGFPTCAEAKAVGPAIAAVRRGDYREIERLGCVPYTPRDMVVRVIGCASSVVDRERPWFKYPVERDEVLPDNVCKIETWLPNGWSATLYTDFMNIIDQK